RKIKESGRPAVPAFLTAVPIMERAIVILERGSPKCPYSLPWDDPDASRSTRHRPRGRAVENQATRPASEPYSPFQPRFLALSGPSYFRNRSARRPCAATNRATTF